jgi:transcriptional regulator with XRE-family HTH domain
VRRYDAARVVENIGRRIADVRRGRGLTQAQLAERMGISERRVQYVEGGEKSNLTVWTLCGIANALDCSIEEFFSVSRERLKAADSEPRPQRKRRSARSLSRPRNV